MPIRVVVVDDHPMIRSGLAAIIANHSDIELVGEAADGEAGVALFRALRPDVILMDLAMPGLGGVEAIRAIMLEQTRFERVSDSVSTPGTAGPTRIVVLTMYAGDADVRRALDAGAVGYLLKATDGPRIVAAVRAAARGERVISADIESRLASTEPGVDLTARELEVLVLVARGYRNREIASAIGRTEETVKIHVRNILEKLGAASRGEAVAIATSRGVLHPG